MGKINANSLSYSQDLPPFLAVLRDQYSDQRGSGPDPILAGRRRAVKVRSASEDAEDAPLVLDEHGDVLAGVTVGKDGAATMAMTGEGQGEADNSTNGKKDERKHDNGVAGIGAGKKKRVGKVIGGGEDDGERASGEGDGADDAGRRKRKRTADEKHDSRAPAGASKDASDAKSKTTSGGSKDVAKVAKKKKKARKIQLSFEDDDEDEG